MGWGPVAVTVLACLLTACGGSDARLVGDAGFATSVRWGDCPDLFVSECAEVELPLDWAAPDGERITVLVARRPSPTPGAPQLWLLQGGPGFSGGEFFELIDRLDEQTGMTIYTLDHRGVGHSTRLGCDDPGWVTAGGWPTCLAALESRWGTGLRHFNATAAAVDLGALIELTREPGQEVYVYGLSYGAYWALRYLQLYPDQAQGIVLDSVVAPGARRYSRFDEQFNAVAQELATLCAADAGCAAKLGPDPWGFLTQLFDKVDAGHCPGALADPPRATLRQLLGNLLIDWDGRVVALAVAYRLDRCDDADRIAVANALTYFLGPTPARAELDRLFSPALFANIVMSELWGDPPPTQESLDAQAAAALFSLDWGPYWGPLYDLWPRYAPDDLVGAWPVTAVPVLMLGGTLDPQTPLDAALVAGERLAGPHQTFVTIPWAAHATIVRSPVATPGGDPCGRQLILGFLADPTGPLDRSCLDDLQPVTFSYPAERVRLIMGRDDLWEG